MPIPLHHSLLQMCSDEASELPRVALASEAKGGGGAGGRKGVPASSHLKRRGVELLEALVDGGKALVLGADLRHDLLLESLELLELLADVVHHCIQGRHVRGGRLVVEVVQVHVVGDRHLRKRWVEGWAQTWKAVAVAGVEGWSHSDLG